MCERQEIRHENLEVLLKVMELPIGSRANNYCFLTAANVVDLTEIAPLQDVYMESTEDENGVLIGWSVLDDDLYDNFTVLYCVAAENAQHACIVRLLMISLC